MRILLLIDALGSGGAERQMTYLAISLKKAGCEIRLIQFYDSVVFYEQELAQAGIKVEIRAEGMARWNPTQGKKGGFGAFYGHRDYNSNPPYKWFRLGIQIQNPAVK